ncbi:MAG: hypothetical protein IJW67_09280 [Blautia sp.]|nr:hypothetical protein [Blautia sp.]
MFEELQKLMKPHTDKIVEKAVQENTSEVKAAGVERIMDKLHLSLEEACETMGMTVEEYTKAKANAEKRKQQEIKPETDTEA